MSESRISASTKIGDIKISQEFTIIMNSAGIPTVGKLLRTPFRVLMNNPAILRHWDDVTKIIGHCKSTNVSLESEVQTW